MWHTWHVEHELVLERQCLLTRSALGSCLIIWNLQVIGIPELVSETCLLIGADTLTPSQFSNCTNIATRAYSAFDSGKSFLAGANTLNMAQDGIEGALLDGNATWVADAFARVHAEVSIKDAAMADGIRPDGSFGQHVGIIYNGNYGKD